MAVFQEIDIDYSTNINIINTVQINRVMKWDYYDVYTLKLQFAFTIKREAFKDIVVI